MNLYPNDRDSFAHGSIAPERHERVAPERREGVAPERHEGVAPERAGSSRSAPLPPARSGPAGPFQRAGGRGSRPGRAPLFPAVVAILLFGAGLAQDLTLGYTSYTTVWDGAEDRAAAEYQRTEAVMAILGDQMRIEDDSGLVMLIRLSGEYAGFMFLDPSTRKASFLPMEAAVEVDSAFTLATSELRAGENVLAARMGGSGSFREWPLNSAGCVTGDCPTTVQVRSGGENRTVEVSPAATAEWVTEGAASLPASMETQMEGVPMQMRDLIAVTVISSGVGRFTEDLPGAEVLHAFYSGLANVTGHSGNSGLAPLTSALTAVMASGSSQGMPYQVTTWQEMGFEVGEELAMIAPLLDGMKPPVTVSFSKLEFVSTEPIAGGEDLFHGGGVPEGYALERLEAFGE